MLNLSQIKAVLIDIDGVLYVGKQVVPGSIEAIAMLKEHHIPFRLLTNTTSKSKTEVYKKLISMGFDIETHEIITTVSLTVDYLKQNEIKSCYLVVNDDVRPEFEAFTQTDEKPEIIVIGDIDDAWNYALMNKLFRMIMQGSRVIGLHKGRFYKKEDGNYIDIGVFISGLEYATGKEAAIVGKPSAAFFNYALESLNVSAKDTAMIGDDVFNDILGAQHVGIKGILVQTGKYDENFVAHSGISPDAVMNDLSEVVTKWMDNN